MSDSRMNMFFVSAFTSAIANVTLCIAIVPVIGFNGAAIAAIVSYMFICAVGDFHTDKFFRYRHRRSGPRGLVPPCFGMDGRLPLRPFHGAPV